MGNSKLALNIFCHQWLCIGPDTAPGRWITDMADGNIPMDFIQIFRRKYLINQPHVLIIPDISVLTDSNTAAFLPPVLQCKQSIIYPGSDILTFCVISTKDTAFLMKFFFKLTGVFLLHHIISPVFCRLLHRLLLPAPGLFWNGLYPASHESQNPRTGMYPVKSHLQG